MKRGALLLATWGGMGYLPLAPGTWGTLGAVPLALLLGYLGKTFTFLFLPPFFFLSVWSAGVAEGKLGAEDHPAIVIDEVIGFLLATALLPPRLPILILSFLLFRLFDILKPFPIRWIEGKVSGGLGVVLDDLIAGLFSQGIIRGLCLAKFLTC